MANIVGVIIGLVIAVIMITSVAMPILKNTNTTGWTSTETSVFNNVGVMLVLGLFVLAAGVAVLRSV